ncbi:MAG: ATP-dependent DNA helicase [Elusimicrobiota bacterium]|nr:ATP-dependent DNA helicase [Elusimicrobiota bacterium]
MAIDFTPSQKKAINAPEGEFAVKAGAGTGKTSVLVNRYLKIYSSLSDKLTPEEICGSILAVTFTRRAAREMRDRLAGAVPEEALRHAQISTIDSFCSRFLKENAFAAGLDPEFKSLDEVESKLFFRKLGLEVLEEEVIWPLDIEKPRESFLNDVYLLINGLQQELISPRQFNEGLVENEEIHRAVYLLYSRYLEAMDKENYMDFGRVLNGAYSIVQKNKNIREAVQNKFKYVLVDEYQDTNPAQVELLTLIARPQNNYFVVGDEQQSIFAFRGAHPEHIVDFFKGLGEKNRAVLKENFRSASPVPELVNEIFKDEIAGYHPIESTLRGKAQIKLYLGREREQEAEYIASKTREFLDSGYSPDDIVVLFRGVKNCAVYEEKMRKFGVKTVTVGGAGFYDQPEIKDIIAMLTVLDNPCSGRELVRLLQSPYFGLKDSELAEILAAGSSESGRGRESLFERIKDSSNPKIRAFMNFLKDFSGTKRRLSLVELINAAARRTGIFYRASSANGGVDSRPMSNLNKFINMARNFEGRNIFSTLYDFIEYLRKVEDAEIVDAQARPRVKNVVNLMTVHQAKGLEFPVVFVSNVTPGNFPGRNLVDMYHFRKGEGLIIRDKDKKSRFMELLNTELYRQNYEEEKRLFYVALTRTRRHLFITGTKNSRGKISKFMSFFLEEAGKDFKLRSGIKDFLKREEKLSEKEIPEPEAVGEREDSIEEFLKASEGLGLPGFIKVRDIPVEFSVTKIETYIRCPLLYKFRYVLDIPEPPSEENFSAALFGSAVHRALEEYYKLKPLGPADMKEKIKSLILSSGVGQKIYDESYSARTAEIVESIRNSDMLKPPEEIISTEQPFVLDVDGKRIKGTIDRIDRSPGGGVHLIDYKTAGSADTAHYRLQISIYMEALKEIFNFKDITPYIYFVSINRIEEVRPLKFVKMRVKSAVSGIQGEKFSPIPGSHCRWCPYTNICPS